MLLAPGAIFRSGTPPAYAKYASVRVLTKKLHLALKCVSRKLEDLQIAAHGFDVQDGDISTTMGYQTLAF